MRALDQRRSFAGLSPAPQGLRSRRKAPDPGPLRAALLLTALLFTACGGGPDLKREIELQPGQAVEIAYVTKDLRLALENDARQAQRPDPMAAQRAGTKRFGTQMAQDLLDVLATYDFFQRAAAAPAPQAPDHVLAWIDGQTYVFSRPRWDGTPANQEATQSFLNCVRAVQDFYNATLSFYGSDMTAEDLQREQEKARQRAEEARRRRR